MRGMPRYRLLGGLEAGSARLGGPRQRAVLAALLLRANDTATIGYLTRATWEDPPVAPESNLRTYVARLRSILPAAGLVTEPGGYSLRVAPDDLDLARFEQAAGYGAKALADADYAAADEYFRSALSWWRGQPLDGQPVGPALRAELERLQDRRFAVIEQHARARLELGDHEDLAGELRRLVGTHPLREELSVQLMLVLHRSGRPAEALDVYRRTRLQLVRELGIEPGPRLRRIQQEILGGENSGGLPGPVPAPQRRLPMDIHEFTGRGAELAELRELVTTAGDAVVVCVIEGMGGVGKTRLAIHAAHRFAAEGRFAQVQLWADLRGHDDTRPPADPAEVLGTFLRSLGVPGEQLPPDLDERAAMLRARLAGRQALILLDDAASEEQVRPLLPGEPGCLVLITSRRGLGGLDGTLTVGLEPFSTGEGVDLLGRILGPRRIAAEPAAAAMIVQQCGRLPLAVTVAARRLRSRRSWRLADLAERLAAGNRRLDQLSVGGRTVRAVFELSYAALPAGRQRMFRLAALHPGEDLTAGSAAAVAGLSIEEAEQELDALLDVYLLEQIEPGRYRFHDLVRDFARELIGRAEQLALPRLFDWYLRTADAADRQLQPLRRRLPLDPGDAEFAGAAEAMSWLEAERGNLVRVVEAAARHGCHRVAWRLPVAMLGWFYLRKHWTEWLATYRLALDSAEQVGDPAAQAMVLNGLGVACSDLSRYDEAISYHQQALRLERATGDRSGQAWNLNNLGVAYSDLGRLRQAHDCFRQAVELHEQAGSCHGQGIALANLGDSCRGLGDLDAATGHLREAIAIQRTIGDHAARYTYSCLGDVQLAQRRPAAAVESYRLALAASRQAGDRWQTAIVQTRLADSLRALGRHPAAKECLRSAAAILDDLGGGPKAEQLRAGCELS